MFSIIATMLAMASPSLQAEPALIEAGLVRTGPQLVQVFNLHNSSKQTVELISAESGCGCAKPTLEKLKLAPGEQTRLTMTVNTLTQPAGKQSWRTTIRYRTGDALQSLEVRLVAELVREVSITPPELALSTESTAKHTLKLTDIRQKPLQVQQVLSSHPALKVKLGEAKAGEQRLELELEESYPVQQATETVRLLTDDASCKELLVPVKIHKRPKTAWRISPEAVHLKLGSDGQASRLVQIRHKDGQTFQIDRVESDQSGISAKWSQDSGPVQTVRVQLNNPPGEGTANLTIRLKSGEPRTCLVPVSWIR